MGLLRSLFRRRPRVEKTDLARRFEFYGRAGHGSMSQVWRARDLFTGRVVAVKILDVTKTRRFESRFLGLKKPSEGEIAIQLRHPHIVRTFEHGISTNNEQFLVMEFIEGVNLSYLTDVQNDVMRTHCLRFAIELGEAIAYFHEQGWIHRDICPRNVLVDRDLSVKLIDFGLVVPNTEAFRKPGNRTGTANYMAPELIRRQWTDQRIDVFSYSVTCFEMWTGKLPWKGGETLEMVLQHLNSPPTEIRSLVPHIDPTVAETIMRGLASSPDDRWPDIASMVQRFRLVWERQREAAPAD